MLPNTDIDYDDLDMILQDAISDDEGRLTPTTLLHHLEKHGWTITKLLPKEAA